MITPQIDAIRKLCDSRGVALVEDAAHAHGSSYDGRMAGTFGLAGAFSFYPTKVTTSGEGGMVLTASAQVRDEARIYRDQGKGAFTTNHHVRDGASWRHERAQRRRRRGPPAPAEGVRAGAAGRSRRATPPRWPTSTAWSRWPSPAPASATSTSTSCCCPQGTDRARFKAEVADRFDVRLSGEVYDLPLHKQPALLKYANGALPVAEDVCARHDLPAGALGHARRRGRPGPDRVTSVFQKMAG